MTRRKNGDVFPHTRPPALPGGELSGSARAYLRAVAAHSIAVNLDSINELREQAEICKTERDRLKAVEPQQSVKWANAHITCLHAIGQLAMKTVDAAIGRTMTLNMSIRSQEDLVDWAALPAESQQKLSEALEIAIAAGVDFTSPRVALPVPGRRVD